MNQKLFFCTLFDSNYLSRGLAMYESLLRNCENFDLYIFSFDQYTYDFFTHHHFKNIIVISLQDFEDKKLLEIKSKRSRAEYCWTCTPSTIKYVIEKYNVPHCTYLDSDLFFYSSPQPLIDEMGNASVSIIPHRYTPKYDQSATSGIYCVQFMTFKNDSNGLEVLNWWRDACIEWCYARFENGKFGDQKYLDFWPTQFKSVKVLSHLGGGVAPWNMQQYDFYFENEKLIGIEKKTKNKFEIIFFHFHSFSFLSKHFFTHRPKYKRSHSVIEHITIPYKNEIESIRNSFNDVSKIEKYYNWKQKIKFIIEIFLRRGLKEFYYFYLLHFKFKKNG